MHQTSAHRNLWFAVRIVMTGLLAVMLLVGRLPSAASAQEAPAGEPAGIEAAEEPVVEEAPPADGDAVPADGDDEQPTGEGLVDSVDPVASEPAVETIVEPAVDAVEEPVVDGTGKAPKKKSSQEVSTDPQVSAPRAAPMAAPGDGDVTASGKVTLEQWANETGATGWQTGNLNSSNSDYAEGEAVAFRTTVDGVSPGSHTLVIEWDTTKAGKHSYDYITGYDWSESATPCTDQLLCSMAKSGPTMPNDSNVVFPYPAGQFAISGGTVTNISSITRTGTYAGDSTASVTVTFNATQLNVVLAWGGHIASGADWGFGTTAGNISGSSYHMRVKQIDTSPTGNQDRSLSANAVTPAAALSMAKAASDTTPAIGQAFDYTITLTNSGTADATGVTVSDLVPAIFTVTGVTTTSATGTCGAAGQQVSCSNLTVPRNTALAGDGVRTVTISVAGPAAADCGKSPTNTASSNQAADASVGVTTPACAPSVTMAKTASDTTPAIGEAFGYTVTLVNSGYADATGVTVSDAVPGIFDVTGVSTSSATGSCSFTDQQVDCLNLTVPKRVGATNGSITVAISVAGPAAADCGMAPTNTATSNQAANASVVVTTPACFASLSMAKSASDTTPAIGQAFDYTVTLTNSGFLDATGVSVSDLVPAIFDVTGVAETSATGSCSFVDQQVDCTNLTVPKRSGGVDGSITVTISVAGPAASDCGQAPTNTASSNQAADASVVVTTPACFADLDMAKTNDNAAPALGVGFSYTVTFSNTGYADATAVTLVDQIPSAFNFATVVTSSLTGTCAESPAVSNLVECTGLTVPARFGAVDGVTTVTITVDGPAVADCGKTFINEAGSDGGTSVSGPMTADDDPGVTTPACPLPAPSPSIDVKKTSDVADAELGDVVTYTYVITNTGDQTLSALDLEDDKIPGITIDPATTLAPAPGPGHILTLTAEYTITQADVDSGGVTNVATATGQPPAGAPVQATDTVTVPVGSIIIEDPGFLIVTKSVVGDHEGQGYAYSVDCGAHSLGDEGTFRLPANGGRDEVGAAIPVGTTCRVVETDAGGADATSVSVNGGAAQDARSAIVRVGADGARVAFTNTFDAAPDRNPRDPDPRDPAPSLPATGSDVSMQLLISLAALLLGGTLVRVTRPRRQGWLRA